MSLDINLTGVEKTSNKKTNLTDNSDTFYPSQKAVKTAVDAKFNTPTGTTAQYLRGDGSLETFPTIPDVTGLQSKAVVVSTNQTAVNDGNYTVVANATFTDPTPVEGKGYRVFVRNGTATINAVAYTVGTSVFRVFHSGAWVSYVSLPDSNFVPTTRTINGYDLSANRTLTASDVGAVATNSAITGATKTKITYDAKGLVTSGADATTADIADSSNKRYVTDANLTVIGNTSNTNTGDETQSTILSKLGFFQSNRIVESTAVTGTLLETIIDNTTIPANTYLSGGIMRVYNSKFRKVGANGLFTVKIYIGPTANNLTGATLIGTFATTGAAPLYIEGLRTFTCTTSGILGFNATTSSNTDTAGQTSSARLSATIDWTVAQNIMFTVTLASASDSVTMIGNSIKNF